MDAQDVLPSRLERAKLDMRALMSRLEGNDFGVVLFAGEAFVYMPLTYDINSANVYLDAITTEATTRQGTLMNEAVERAIEMFDAQIGSQSTIILASDGEHHEGDLQVAAQKAAEQGIVVYTLGYGTIEGANIPLYDDEGNLTEYLTDEGNNIVTTYLVEETLAEIALTTGGLYQRAGATGTEIDTLVERISQIEGASLGEKEILRNVERFGLFILLALLGLSLEILLPETRRGSIL